MLLINTLSSNKGGGGTTGTGGITGTGGTIGVDGGVTEAGSISFEHAKNIIEKINVSSECKTILLGFKSKNVGFPICFFLK